MKTKLKVLNTKSAGKELPVTVDQFLIGRDGVRKLRPGSDAIAAKHCQLTRRDGGFWAKDLGSETGTFVNGERLAAERQLNPGDKLRVGPLEFEVLIEYEVSSQRAEKVKDVRDAAARVVKKADKEPDLDSLLFGGDDDAQEEAPRSKQFDINEITAAVEAEKAAEEAAREAKELKKSGGKKFGKLPKQEEAKDAKDTREAANEMLRRMFKK